MKISKASENCLNIIIQFEGCYLRPYLCPAGIPTIGIGATYYEDGKRVTLKDQPITKERAILLLKNLLINYERSVDSMTRDDINQNQFDSLVSFVYNVGANNFKQSTLLKLVNQDPNNPLIAVEFLKWNKAGGKTLNGLTKRRKVEMELYFKK